MVKFYLLIVLSISDMGMGNAVQTVTQFKTSEQCEAAAEAVRSAIDSRYPELNATMGIIGKNQTQVICREVRAAR
jgi:hypothetical protein